MLYTYSLPSYFSIELGLLSKGYAFVMDTFISSAIVGMFVVGRNIHNEEVTKNTAKAKI